MTFDLTTLPSWSYNLIWCFCVYAAIWVKLETTKFKPIVLLSRSIWVVTRTGILYRFSKSTRFTRERQLLRPFIKNVGTRQLCKMLTFSERPDPRAEFVGHTTQPRLLLWQIHFVHLSPLDFQPSLAEYLLKYFLKSCSFSVYYTGFKYGGKVPR